MARTTTVDMLRGNIYQIQKSKESKNKDDEICTIHLSADVFVRLAEVYIGIHGGVE